ncbi:MAG: chemotaxis protein CheW [Gemmatimonadales bacterium]|nr:chemotaxis protein CheW [Gemmatimonadales bacterium]
MTALKLLLFRSGGQVFAVEAGAVQEILPATPPTRMPGAPGAVRGLVNVRGTLVTVVDAAEAIGLPSGLAAGSGTVILMERRSRPVGLAVDEVIDLVTVPTSSLDDRASLPGVRPDLVRAVGSAAGQTFVQLDTDVLLEPLLP